METLGICNLPLEEAPVVACGDKLLDIVPNYTELGSVIKHPNRGAEGQAELLTAAEPVF